MRPGNPMTRDRPLIRHSLLRHSLCAAHNSLFSFFLFGADRKRCALDQTQLMRLTISKYTHTHGHKHTSLFPSRPSRFSLFPVGIQQESHPTKKNLNRWCRGFDNVSFSFPGLNLSLKNFRSTHNGRPARHTHTLHNHGFTDLLFLKWIEKFSVQKLHYPCVQYGIVYRSRESLVVTDNVFFL